MNILSLQNITISIGDFKIEDLNFQIRKGTYCVLLGESGSGKSLILKAITGIQAIQSGEIFFKDKEISKLKIQNRKIGLLFQDYALFPHLTVFQNIAFPLKINKRSKIEIENEVNQLAAEFGISDLLQRHPNELSGGEQQRVALARILAFQPEILLLDEPLSALDASLKNELRNLLRKINRKGITIIHVTHDFEEALALAKHIIVLDNGKIIQQGGPAEVFRNPNSSFVAHFTGVKNFYKANITNPNIATITDSISLKINSELKKGENCFLLIRAEEITLSKEKIESSATNKFKGIIKLIVMNQYGFEILIDIGRDIYAVITSQSADELKIAEGMEIWVNFKTSAVKIIEIQSRN